MCENLTCSCVRLHCNDCAQIRLEPLHIWCRPNSWFRVTKVVRAGDAGIVFWGGLGPWLSGTCQMGRLVQCSGRPPRLIFKGGRVRVREDREERGTKSQRGRRERREWNGGRGQGALSYGGRAGLPLACMSQFEESAPVCVTVFQWCGGLSITTQGAYVVSQTTPVQHWSTHSLAYQGTAFCQVLRHHHHHQHIVLNKKISTAPVKIRLWALRKTFIKEVKL